MSYINVPDIVSDTAANFASANTVLPVGRIAYATDQKAWKIGDGTTAYNSLPYMMDEQRIRQVAARAALVSNTSAQAIFDSVTNGQLTVLASMLYEFECSFRMTALSASSGDFSFGFGGTATFTTCAYIALSAKAGAAAGGATITYGAAATATSLVAANTSTAGHAWIKGQFRINGAGTIIPQITQGVASTAIIAADSYFTAKLIGPSAFISNGPWT